MIDLYGTKFDIEAFSDPDKLIAQRPRVYSPEQAEKEVYDQLMNYMKIWAPEDYARIPQGTSLCQPHLLCCLD